MTSVLQPLLARTTIKVLLVEDNSNDAELIAELLLETHLARDFILTKVVRVGEAVEYLNEESFDVILLDLSLPDSQGCDTVARVRECGLKIPIVVLTSNNDEQLALQSIQAGAQDYLRKRKIDSETLVRSLRYAIERQRSLQERQQSEEKYRALVNSLKEAIFQTDAAGNCIFLNSAWTEITGFKIKSSLGKKFLKCIDDTDRPRYLEELSSLLQREKKDNSFKIRLRTASGKVRTFEVRQRLTFAPDGTVSGTVGTLNDITDRQLAIEALHHSEIRWRSYFENSLVGMAIAAPQIASPLKETWIDVNEALCNLLGYPPDELIVKTWAELTHPDDLETELEQLSQIYAGEKNGYVLDKRLLRKDGGVVYTRVSVRAVRREDGSIYHSIAMVVDVSDRYRYEQQLKASEDFLHHTLDAIADPIFVKDESHKFIIVNQALCQLMNCERSHIIGRTDYDFFSKEEADVFWEKDELVLRTGAENENEETLTDGDGNLHVISTKKNVFENADGSKILVGAIRDVTQYKRQQAALQESEARFQRLVANVPGTIYQFRLSADKKISFPYISSGGRELYEIEPEAIAQNAELAFEGVHPTDIDALKQSIAVSAETLQPWQREWRQIMPSGKVKWIKGASRPQKQANGDILWDGLLMDITELKQTQQERDRFFTISLDLLCIANFDGYFKRLNPAWFATLGYTEEELFTKAFIEFVHPEDRETTLAEVQKLVTGALTIHFENRYLCKDGSYKWFAWTAAPFISEGLIYAVARDVSDRKRAEEALRESQHFIQQIAESNPNILYLYDLVEQRNVFINRNIAQILGYGQEEIREMGSAILPNLMHPEDFARFPEYLKQIEQGSDGDIFEIEYRMRHSNGTWHWLVSREVVFARTSEGKPKQLIGTATDITEFKQKTEELAKSARQSALRSDVGFALAQSGDLSSRLSLCTQFLVKHIDVVFARIWTLNREENVLELQASAGLYSHINGAYARVSVGSLKIGLIAAELQPHLTNDVQNDPLIGDKEWARREGIVAFAGYPLIVENQLIGVMAMFARHSLSEQMLEDLALVANEIAVGIERKRSAIALQQSQQRLQLALEASALGLWDWNLVTGETYFDPQWKKMLGYEIEEIDNNFESWEQLVHPEDLSRAMEVLNAYLRGETPLYETEYRMRSKSGEWKWIWDLGKVVDRDESGQPLRMTGTHKDISARIAAEKALLEREQQLQEAQRVAHIGSWEFDPATGTITWSDELFRIWDCDRSDIPTFDELVQLVHPDDREFFVENVQTSINSGNPYDFDHRIVWRNGEIRYLNSKAQAIKNESGRVVRLCGTGMDITERKLAEKATLKLTHQLQEAQRIAHIGNWEVDGITLELDWSNEMFRIWGIEPGEPFTYDDVIQNIHSEDRASVLAAIERAVAEGNPYDIDHRIIRPNGEIGYVNVKGQAIKNEAGIVVRYFGTLMDISDRKRSEEALRESEQRFRAIFEYAALGIAQLWPDGQFLKVNSGFCNIVGYSQSELRLRNFMQISYAEDWLKELEYSKRMLAGEMQSFSLEKRFIRKDGACVWTNATISLVRDASGEPKYAIAIVEDISDRKQAEETLRQQFLQQQLVGRMLDRIRSSLNLDEVLTTAVEEVRQFLQTDRTIIYRFNPDWSGVVTVESVGEEWMATFGIDIQDNCFVTTHVPLYQKGRTRAIEDIYNSGLNQCHVELLSRLQVKANLVVPILQGKKLWGLLIAHHCRSARAWQEFEIECLKQLSVQLAIAIQQSTLFQQAQIEIVERKIAESAMQESEARERSKALQLELALNQLRNAQTQLVQQEKMASLGQMVAGIAHEINNPVSFIYGNLIPATQYATDLLQLVKLYQQHYPEPVSEILDEIEAIELEYVSHDLPKLFASMKVGAERIKEIVKSLRCFSRLDEAEKKSVDIREGIESTLMILQHRLKANGDRPSIHIVQNYQKLPLVECYAGQLNQVFMNILTNAIDALEERDKQRTKEAIALDPSTITIRTYLSREGSAVISIADNGPGIPESVRQRLFDPFFTTKPVGKGTGLGLSISHSIVVERHGGTLTCTSTPGQGTEFIIEIPQKQ